MGRFTVRHAGHTVNEDAGCPNTFQDQVKAREFADAYQKNTGWGKTEIVDECTGKVVPKTDD